MSRSRSLFFSLLLAATPGLAAAQVGDRAELIAEGHTLHACVDDTGRVSRLPGAVRRLLET